MFLSLQTFTKGALGISIELKHNSLYCFRQLTIQLPMRLKALKPKLRIYQIVLVVLVMPVELVEETKICQIPES